MNRNKKPDYYYCRAYQYTVKKYWDKALTDINEAIKFQPNDVDYLVQKTRILIGKNSFEEAYKLLNETYQIESTNEDLLYVGAQLYLDQMDSENALIWLNRILAIKPTDASCIVSIARIESSVYGNTDRAIEILEEGLRKNADAARLYFAKSFFLLMKKQWNMAYDAIKKAIELDSTETKYHQLYGFLMSHCEKTLSYTL